MCICTAAYSHNLCVCWFSAKVLLTLLDTFMELRSQSYKLFVDSFELILPIARLVMKIDLISVSCLTRMRFKIFIYAKRPHWKQLRKYRDVLLYIQCASYNCEIMEAGSKSRMFSMKTSQQHFSCTFHNKTDSSSYILRSC